jgi:hypothetical protein
LGGFLDALNQHPRSQDFSRSGTKIASIDFAFLPIPIFSIFKADKILWWFSEEGTSLTVAYSLLLPLDVVKFPKLAKKGGEKYEETQSKFRAGDDRDVSGRGFILRATAPRNDVAGKWGLGTGKPV